MRCEEVGKYIYHVPASLLVQQAGINAVLAQIGEEPAVPAEAAAAVAPDADAVDFDELSDDDDDLPEIQDAEPTGSPGCGDTQSCCPIPP